MENENARLHVEREETDTETPCESSCSTPYVSAPSSPTRTSSFSFSFSGAGGFFLSAPASPRHHSLNSQSTAFSFTPASFSFFGEGGSSGGFSMSSADELFLNGQIRPMSLLSHLQLPQSTTDEPESPNRSRSVRRSGSVQRKSRSLSPLRNAPLHWPVQTPDRPDPAQSGESPPPAPATASRSSSSSSSSSSCSSNRSTSSKKWIFLKDLLLHRSKSDQGSRTKDKEQISRAERVNPERKPPPTPAQRSPAARGGRRRSAHERFYAANRAAAAEMRRRTFLPYRQGLLGCLGFSSRGYGVINGLARGINSVSSR